MMVKKTLFLSAAMALLKATSAANKTVKEADHLLQFQGEESALFLQVDSKVAAKYVPASQPLYIENGFAQIVVAVQTCSVAAYDGAPLPPNSSMNHVWIRLAGPLALDAVPGASQTLPTMYWYNFLEQSTSQELAQKLNEVGFDTQVVDSIDLGTPANGIRQGKLVENAATGAGLSWTINMQPFISDSVGVNHNVYKEQGDGARMSFMEPRGLVQWNFRDSPVMVNVHPKSKLAVFGTILYGMSHDFNMGFTVQIHAESKDDDSKGSKDDSIYRTGA